MHMYDEYNNNNDNNNIYIYVYIHIYLCVWCVYIQYLNHEKSYEVPQRNRGLASCFVWGRGGIPPNVRF